MDPHLGQPDPQQTQIVQNFKEGKVIVESTDSYDGAQKVYDALVEKFKQFDPDYNTHGNPIYIQPNPTPDRMEFLVVVDKNLFPAIADNIDRRRQEEIGKITTDLRSRVVTLTPKQTKERLDDIDKQLTLIEGRMTDPRTDRAQYKGSDIALRLTDQKERLNILLEALEGDENPALRHEIDIAIDLMQATIETLIEQPGADADLRSKLNFIVREFEGPILPNLERDLPTLRNQPAHHAADRLEIAFKVRKKLNEAVENSGKNLPITQRRIEELRAENSKSIKAAFTSIKNELDQLKNQMSSPIKDYNDYAIRDQRPHDIIRVLSGLPDQSDNVKRLLATAIEIRDNNAKPDSSVQLFAGDIGRNFQQDELGESIRGLPTKLQESLQVELENLEQGPLSEADINRILDILDGFEPEPERGQAQALLSLRVEIHNLLRPRGQFPDRVRDRLLRQNYIGAIANLEQVKREIERPGLHINSAIKALEKFNAMPDLPAQGDMISKMLTSARSTLSSATDEGVRETARVPAALRVGVPESLTPAAAPLHTIADDTVVITDLTELGRQTPEQFATMIADISNKNPNIQWITVGNEKLPFEDITLLVKHVPDRLPAVLMEEPIKINQVLTVNKAHFLAVCGMYQLSPSAGYEQIHREAHMEGVARDKARDKYRPSEAFTVAKTVEQSYDISGNEADIKLLMEATQDPSKLEGLTAEQLLPLLLLADRMGVPPEHSLFLKVGSLTQKMRDENPVLNKNLMRLVLKAASDLRTAVEEGDGPQIAKQLSVLGTIPNLSLDLTKGDLSLELLTQLAKLPNLGSLNISGQQGLHFEKCQAIGNLRSLHTLDASNTDAEDILLNELRRNLSETLKHLNLSGSQVTNRGTPILSDLRALETLGIARLKLNEAPLDRHEAMSGFGPHVSKLQNLKSLDVSDTASENDDISHAHHALGLLGNLRNRIRIKANSKQLVPDTVKQLSAKADDLDLSNSALMKRVQVKSLLNEVDAGVKKLNLSGCTHAPGRYKDTDWGFLVKSDDIEVGITDLNVEGWAITNDALKAMAEIETLTELRLTSKDSTFNNEGLSYLNPRLNIFVDGKPVHRGA